MDSAKALLLGQVRIDLATTDEVIGQALPVELEFTDASDITWVRHGSSLTKR